MSYNWIDAKEFSFNSFLLMDRWILGMICRNMAGWADFENALGIALNHSPAVAWYFVHKCPECAPFVERIMEGAPKNLPAADARAAEVFVIDATETSIVYCYPEIMDSNCDYIYNWDKERLFELADFAGKIVLDIGSGTGRLAFAAAERARFVYASEPVDRLREYMREKIRRQGIGNVRVLDGTVQEIPYEDNTFDIVMSGHVVGDDYERELGEITRVVRDGGWILDCIGDDDNSQRTPKDELLRRGFEMFHHVSRTGGNIYRYRKQVRKG